MLIYTADGIICNTTEDEEEHLFELIEREGLKPTPQNVMFFLQLCRINHDEYDDDDADDDDDDDV
jgi:hypothetical protein